MQALITFFVELCALRRPPQDLPASQLLFGVTLVADLLVGILVGLTAHLSLLTSFAEGLTEVAMMLAALYAGLELLNRPNRFLQSATALLGSGALLGLAAIAPLMLDPTGSEQTELAALGAFVLLGLVIWGIVVTGHILRHTFSLTLGQGAAVAAAFEVLTVSLVTVMFGGN